MEVWELLKAVKKCNNSIFMQANRSVLVYSAPKITYIPVHIPKYLRRNVLWSAGVRVLWQRALHAFWMLSNWAMLGIYFCTLSKAKREKGLLALLNHYVSKSTAWNVLDSCYLQVVATKLRTLCPPIAAHYKCSHDSTGVGTSSLNCSWN